MNEQIDIFLVIIGGGAFINLIAVILAWKWRSKIIKLRDGKSKAEGVILEIVRTQRDRLGKVVQTVLYEFTIRGRGTTQQSKGWVIDQELQEGDKIFVLYDKDNFKNNLIESTFKNTLMGRNIMYYAVLANLFIITPALYFFLTTRMSGVQ